MTPPLSPRARSEYAATVVSSTHGHRHGPIARVVGTVRSAGARLRGRHLSVGKLAVIRRADGAFVVNVDAGSREHADDLLQLVREQLATMSVAQFEHAWGIDRHVDVVIKRHMGRREKGMPVNPVARIQGARSLRSAG